MENIICAMCGCEQTKDGKILKDGKPLPDKTAQGEINELKAQVKELTDKLLAAEKAVEFLNLTTKQEALFEGIFDF